VSETNGREKSFMEREELNDLVNVRIVLLLVNEDDRI